MPAAIKSVSPPSIGTAGSGSGPGSPGSPGPPCASRSTVGSSIKNSVVKRNSSLVLSFILRVFSFGGLIYYEFNCLVFAAFNMQLVNSFGKLFIQLEFHSIHTCFPGDRLLHYQLP